MSREGAVEARTAYEEPELSVIELEGGISAAGYMPSVTVLEVPDSDSGEE